MVEKFPRYTMCVVFRYTKTHTRSEIYADELGKFDTEHTTGPWQIKKKYRNAIKYRINALENTRLNGPAQSVG